MFGVVIAFLVLAFLATGVAVGVNARRSARSRGDAWLTGQMPPQGVQGHHPGSQHPGGHHPGGHIGGGHIGGGHVGGGHV